MPREPMFDADERLLPCFWTVGTIAALTFAFWFLIIYLSHPTVYPNPGLAAYNPPPGTRLLPAATPDGCPELAELELTAAAQTQTSEEHAKPSKGAVRKTVRVVPRENDERELG